MAGAMDCLRKLRTETEKHFDIIIHDGMKPDADFLKFERFFASLEAIVVRGAKDVITSTQSRGHPAVFSAFLGQLLPRTTVSDAPHCPLGELNTEYESLRAEIARADDTASQFLFCTEQMRIHYQCSLDDCDAHESLRRDTQRMIQLSDRVHAKAKDILMKTHLWDLMPASVR